MSIPSPVPDSIWVLVTVTWLGFCLSSVFVFSVRILTMGMGTVLDTCLLEGPFSSYWVALSSLTVMVCTWSCSMLYLVDVPGQSALF